MKNGGKKLYYQKDREWGLAPKRAEGESFVCETGGAAMGYLVIGGILCLPFVVGWVFLRGKRNVGCGGVIAAIVIFLIYLFISTKFDAPGRDRQNSKRYLCHIKKEYFVNEAFMFLLVEKNNSPQKLHNWIQDMVQAAPPPIPFRLRDWGGAQRLLPYRGKDVLSWPEDFSGSFRWRFRESFSSYFPLSVELRWPDGMFTEELETSVSRWNEDIRIHIDMFFWEEYTHSSLTKTRRIKSFWFYLLWPIGAVFPLAALAFEERRRMVFYGMWGAVLVFYLLFFYHYLLFIRYSGENLPSFPRLRCDPEKSVAILNAPEHREALQNLLREPTSVIKNDPARTLVKAPLLCGGDFFRTRFLCWELGRLHYLYYSPDDLLHAGLLTGNAEIAPMAEGFVLVRYPDLAAACDGLWLRFAAIQGLAGALWLAMFLLALVKRCKQSSRRIEADAGE